MTVEVRPGAPGDEAWVVSTLAERWGNVVMIVRGEEFDLTRLPARPS